MTSVIFRGGLAAQNPVSKNDTLLYFQKRLKEGMLGKENYWISTLYWVILDRECNVF
jgi:hypothetical protein